MHYPWLNHIVKISVCTRPPRLKFGPKYIKVTTLSIFDVYTVDNAVTPVLNEHVTFEFYLFMCRFFFLFFFFFFFVPYGKTNFSKTNIDVSCVNESHSENPERKYHQLSTELSPIIHIHIYTYISMSTFFFFFFPTRFLFFLPPSIPSYSRKVFHRRVWLGYTYWKRIILNPARCDSVYIKDL